MTKPLALKNDLELAAIKEVCQHLAVLAPAARRRVLAYVNARAEALPVIAADDGIEEDQHVVFEPAEAGDVPMLPPFAGAH